MQTLLSAEDAADLETVNDFASGRDFYLSFQQPGRDPKPLTDVPGSKPRVLGMRRRASRLQDLFDARDAPEADRLAFLGSLWGDSTGEFRRLQPVAETSTGPILILPKKKPRPRRPSEGARNLAIRQAEARRKRDARAKRNAAKEPPIPKKDET